MRATRTIGVVLTGFTAASAFVGCNSLVGLDQFSITGTAGSGNGGAAGTASPTTGGAAGTPGAGGMGGQIEDAGDEPRVVECHTNRECTDRATAAAQARYEEAGSADGSDGGPPGTVPAMCIQSVGKCAELLSPDCLTITGMDYYLDDNSILLGTLFSTTGSQAGTNLQRQRSATLAWEEINEKGGLPPVPGSTSRRRIVAVSCDEIGNLTRAATHLIQELRVPAVVGPNLSQDTLTVSQTFSIAAGTVLMTPSAVASSIAALDDNDLTWLMAPTDVQRAPLMIQQINALEAQLKPARGNRPLKLGIIYRNDALGQGTQQALVPLQFNGAALTAPSNAGKVFVDPYAPAAPNQDALVTKYRDFAPDIIAIAGTAEAITRVMVPLEDQWNSEAGAERPYWVSIDSVKVPELLAAVACSLNPASAQCMTLMPTPTKLPADLRLRIRGTGITPTAEAANVLAAFQLAYQGRYMTAATASSTGPSYDAAYAIAFAIASGKDLPVTGKNIAAGLRKLAGGPTVIEVRSTKVLEAFQKLTTGGDGGGENISAIGTFGRLSWDPQGAPVNALLEMWCIGAVNNAPTYQSAQLFYDLEAKQLMGTYTQCP